MFLVAALQVLVFNHINLWGCAMPLMGILAVLYTPLGSSRIGNMCLTFVTGLILDAFSNTPGVAAGAMTATAFVRHYLLQAMVSKDAPVDAVPDAWMLGRYRYFSYLAILMAVHHCLYFLLEAFAFRYVTDLLPCLLGSYALSLLISLSIELFRTSGSE